MGSDFNVGQKVCVVRSYGVPHTECGEIAEGDKKCRPKQILADMNGEVRCHTLRLLKTPEELHEGVFADIRKQFGVSKKIDDLKQALEDKGLYAVQMFPNSCAGEDVHTILTYDSKYDRTFGINLNFKYSDGQFQVLDQDGFFSLLDSARGKTDAYEVREFIAKFTGRQILWPFWNHWVKTRSAD